MKKIESLRRIWDSLFWGVVITIIISLLSNVFGVNLSISALQKICIGTTILLFFIHTKNTDKTNEPNEESTIYNSPNNLQNNSTNANKIDTLPPYISNGIKPHIPEPADTNTRPTYNNSQNNESGASKQPVCDKMSAHPSLPTEEEFINKIKKMKWRKFELFVAEIFKENGYETTVTPKKNDEGKDIIAQKDGITYFIECKHYSSNNIVGREMLQKLGGAALPYNVKHLIFVTLSGYNSNAIEYAKKINDEGEYSFSLLETEDIVALAKKANMIK